jgi:hypothetical protein
MTSILAQAGGAGGAPLADLVGATLVGGALVLIVLAIGGLHRKRRIRWLGALASYAERVSGLPRWSALPAAIGGGALQVALFGFWWDVATHIDKGRDNGPFGTAAHWPILIGLFGIALAGYLSVVLGCDEDEPTAIKLRGGWSAPLGGILLLACGAFALSGFPLDDVWHRLFGQDVTLWGPTHVLMIGSASLATIAVWALLVEGRRSARRSGLRPVKTDFRATIIDRLRSPMIAGGFLIGLSSLQGEFDFGVPQYSLILHPVMLMVAAGCGLVTARIVLGRFGALKALSFYLVLRVALTLIVHHAFGKSVMHFPLYIVEAIVVEAAAFFVRGDRPLRFGVIAGALVGTFGLAAEYAWSHIWMPIPWPSSIFPEAAILGFAAALAGGVLGAYIGGTLRDPETAPRLGPAWVAGLAGAVVLVCIAFPLPKSTGPSATANITLRDTAGPPNRTVEATVRISPPSAAKNTAWLTATAWQGGGLIVNRLHRIGPGVYRTTHDLPVYGKWKSLIRLSDGRGLEAVPIYLPADPAIPAKAVPAPARFTRTFVSDKSILQREAKGGSVFLVLPAYLVLLLIIGGEFFALAWGLRRLRIVATGGRVTQPELRLPRIGGPARPRASMS